MEAVISTGGKQYVVKAGDVIEVEKLAEGTVEFTPLLVTQDGKTMTGKSPKVSASVVEQTKGEKLIVFKMKAKKRYRVKAGHRQKLSRLQIDQITV